MRISLEAQQPSLVWLSVLRKKRQVAAMHAKLRNTRKDWAHKVTTDLVRGAKTVRVGHVPSSRLGKTRLAKSVYEVGWPQLRAVADRQSQSKRTPRRRGFPYR